MYFLFTKKGEKIQVDRDDWKKYIRYKIWIGGKSKYKGADIWLNGKNIKLHRLIMNAKPDQVVDHINHNRLDNRKSNLRCCSQAQNMRNQLNRKKGKSKILSKFKGVSFNKRRNQWIAYITLNYKRTFLGYFQTELEASCAYKRAARKYFGEFAYV